MSGRIRSPLLLVRSGTVLVDRETLEIVSDNCAHQKTKCRFAGPTERSAQRGRPPSTASTQPVVKVRSRTATSTAAPLPRRRQTAQRSPGGLLVAPLGIQGFDEVGVHQAGRHRQHAHRGSQRARQRLSHVVDRRLGGAVHDIAAHGGARRDGGDIDHHRSAGMRTLAQQRQQARSDAKLPRTLVVRI
jgi:hypothetical protein